MATTTNYSWSTPNDTDLVKDGAAAIRTLGSSIDTTTKNLNPSTTLGDIEYRSSTANVNTRLAVGSNGQYLTVTGGVPAWGSVSAGGMTLLSTTTMSGASTTISSISGSYTDLLIIAYDMNPSVAAGVYMQPNATSGLVDSSSSTNYGGTSTTEGYRSSNIQWNGGQNLASSANGVMVTIFQYANTNITYKPFHLVSRTRTTASPNTGTINGGGTIATTSAIDSIKIGIDSGTLTGTVLIYGVK